MFPAIPAAPSTGGLITECLLLIKSAEFKALFPLSMADAWIAACAAEQGAVLLHKDPEFKPLPVLQELLPLKSRRSV
jgi:hypothetical protein